MKKIKYGIIGAGGMGQGHLACIEMLEDVELVGVADNYAKSLDAFQAVNRNKKTKYFPDYKLLLEIDEIDAVIISTPGNSHVDIVSDAIAAGKHVLSEKPAATTLKDLERLQSIVSSSPKIFQLGLECRYLPVFQRMHKMIKDGVIGNPRMIWCKEFRDPFLKKVNNWIMFNETSGGVFVEKTCHYFDLMNWFSCSRPRSVIAIAGQDVVKDIYGVKPDIFDNGWVMIEYENNVKAVLGLCMFCNCRYDVEMGIIGETAMMEGFFNQSRIKLVEYGTNTTSAIQVEMDEKSRKLSHSGGVYLEHLAFIENIRENKNPLTGIEVAKWSTLVGLAAEESARNGSKAVIF